MGFNYGCRHCPLNKTRLAAYATGLIASPDVIWSWGFNCDEGPKTDELIQCLLGEEWTYVISRIPHDTYFCLLYTSPHSILLEMLTDEGSGTMMVGEKK